MSTYDDILYAHPALRSVWYLIQSGLKTYGLEGKLGSVHRLPEEQFALFRKGRVYVKGEWVVDSDPATSTVTTKDGYVKPSHHNMLPTGAVDINLFRGGAYLKKFEDYTALGQIVQPLGLEWGGNWKSLKDGPHIQIFDNQCLGGSAKRECGEQWQRYLVEKAGKDIGVIDGYPGAKTLAALKEVTGHDTLCPAAWKALYDKFGPLIP